VSLLDWVLIDLMTVALCLMILRWYR